MADNGFWQRAWADGSPGRTGSGRAGPHPDLVAHAGTAFAGAARLLVPLCGRSPDLAWLAGGWPEVVGVELVERAVAGYAAEHSLAAHERPVGAFRRYSRGGLSVLLGDFFDATPDAVGTFDGAWDRGALGALPPTRRDRYGRVLLGLLRPGATVLAECYTFDQRRLPGPPYSVSGPELGRLFGEGRVRVIEDRTLTNGGRYPGMPLRRWRQRVYAIDVPPRMARAQTAS
jgi:thiopurine S-methyltransferase